MLKFSIKQISRTLPVICPLALISELNRKKITICSRFESFDQNDRRAPKKWYANGQMYQRSCNTMTDDAPCFNVFTKPAGLEVLSDPVLYCF